MIDNEALSKPPDPAILETNYSDHSPNILIFKPEPSAESPPEMSLKNAERSNIGGRGLQSKMNKGIINSHITHSLLCFVKIFSKVSTIWSSIYKVNTEELQ